MADKLFGSAHYDRELEGRYRLLSRIGEGGMGVVDLAFDRKLDRHVAIKRLHRAKGHTRGTTGLRAEARALAQTSHPNIVEVFDVVVEDGDVFVVMEYVRGRSLSQVRRDGAPVSRLLDALLQAGQGLLAAHERGLVHRDFKPSNVLVDEHGRSRVCDFGLARSLSETGDDSDEASVHGTPVFMAPEQHHGAELDPRADQFAFCVTAWVMLTQERPFAGSGRALVRAKDCGPPAWPPSASETPLHLIEALRRGLSPDPAQRWPSMADLLRAMKGPGANSTFWSPWRLGAIALSLVAIGSTVGLAQQDTTAAAFGEATISRPARRSLEGRQQLHEARQLGFDGEIEASQERMREAFERASTAGNVGSATEAAAWLAINTPSERAFESEEWAKTAERLQAELAPSPRLAALVSLADGAAKLRASRPEDAKAPIERGVRLVEGLNLPEGVYAYQLLASMQWHRGDYPRAIETTRFAEAAARREFGVGHVRVNVARLSRGKLHRAAGELQEAEVLLESVIADCEPRSTVHGRALLSLASTKLALIKFDEAEEMARSALAIIETHETTHATSLYGTLILLAQIAETKGRIEEAIAYHERLRVAAEENGGQNTQALGVAYSRLASLNDSMGKPELAESYYERSIAAFEGAQQPVAAAGIGANFANFLAEHGEFDRARVVIDKALPRLREANDEESLVTAEAALGLVALGTGDYSTAQHHFAAARAHVEKLYGPQHPVVGMLMAREAQAVALDGRPAEALFQRSIKQQADGGAPPEIYAFTELWFAQALWADGKQRRARALVKKARPIAAKHPGATPPELDEIDAWIERTAIVDLSKFGGSPA